MEILGIYEDKKLLVNNKKILDDIFIYIKGTIFNIDEINKKFAIKEKKLENKIKSLYIKTGLKFIKELDGSFTIVIYDKKLNKIYLIKDKLGNEPLYYYFNHNKLIFSTSLKLIMQDKSFPKIISKQALTNYMGYFYIYEPLTIFENTFKVEKGSIITFNGNNIKKDPYYDIWEEYHDSKKEKRKDVKTYKKEYEKLIKDSIAKRGTKDSQVGILMSSGKDSVLIAKLASEYFNPKINTYTLGFENKKRNNNLKNNKKKKQALGLEKEKDESIEAQKISEYIGSNHHTFILKEEDFLETLKKSATIYDEPFADPSIIPCIYLIENIKEKNDFYLTGDAGDEIFLNMHYYRIFGFKARIQLTLKKRINRFNKKRVYENFDEYAQVNVINRFNYADRLIGVKGKVFPIIKEKEKIRSSSIGDLKYMVSEKYRVKVESPMNYYNLKYFTPYYDEQIIKKSFETPTKMIYKNHEGKHILNKVLFDHIPEHFFKDYRKKGFGIPLIDWINKIILKEIKEISKKEFITKQNLFNYKELIQLISDFEQNPNYNKASILWNYYIFQLWYKNNIAI